MIPVANNMTQTDTLPGAEIAFSIGDPRWVMRSMADLYSNRELAVVREYSTNAADANKEYAILEGEDIEPIDVTLPSMMNPYFKVRDYGYGMSAEVLSEVYTKFGDSTKRVSNEFNGMLGFGCKSAVAYTSTFTVTSVHNGTKTVAVVTRKPDYSIVMKIVSSTPTTERSGTEVVVPVHNWDEFTQKGNDFYKFWLPGTVLVNGRAPEHAVGEKIVDGLYYSEHWSRSYVVMGNVPYRIENPDALFRNSKMNFINFVAYVDNGDVEFTPSREDLKYTDHTKETLRKVIAGFEVKIANQAQQEIDGAENHADAFLAWSKWCRVLGRDLFSVLTFKGDKFCPVFSVSGTRWSPAAYRYTTNKVGQWNVEAMPNTIIITEFDVTLASRHKNMVREYLKINDIKVPSSVIFTASKDSEIISEWIPRDRLIRWADLKSALPVAPRKPRQPRAGRLKGTFDYWTRTGFVSESQLPDDTDVYYVTSKASKEAKASNNLISSVLDLIDSDAAVVVLGLNRIEKFKRENPSTKEFFQYARTFVVQDGGTLLSDDAKHYLRTGYTSTQWAKKLDVSRIDDPLFAKVRTAAANEASLLKAYNNNLRLCSLLNEHPPKARWSASTSEPLLDAYPLLRQMLMHAKFSDDIYIYLNAAYAAK